MQLVDFRSFAILKVASHGIADLLAEFLHGIRFGEDGFSEGTGCEASFRGFFDEKDHFIDWRSVFRR
jgi:hypothetical protein